MLNSNEHIIDNFPEPLRKALYAVYGTARSSASDGYSYYEEKDLYLALLDLQEWFEKQKWGESILPKVLKFLTKRDRDKCVKSIKEWKKDTQTELTRF